MASPTLQSLAAEIERLKRALEPQTLRNSMELTFDPKGGEPRIIDENGRTLDYTPNIQLLGGTTTLDAVDQRIIYTATAAGSGGGSAIFSDDTTIVDAERYKFVGQTAPTTIRSSLQGSTTVGTGNLRRLDLLLAESDVTTQPRERLTFRNGDTGDAAVPYRVELVAEASSTNTGGLTANIRSGTGVVSHDVNVFGVTGAGNTSTNLTATADTMTATVTANGNSLSGIAKVTFTTNGTVRTLYSSNAGESQFMQVSGDSGSANTPIKLVTRGPFQAAPGSIAAGATGAVTVSAALYGTAAKNVVCGHVNGAAGMELVLVSWVAGPAANQITLNFSNTSGGALTPVFEFTTVSDA